jgi:hypothetical protein
VEPPILKRLLVQNEQTIFKKYVKNHYLIEFLGRKQGVLRNKNKHICTISLLRLKKKHFKAFKSIQQNRLVTETSGENISSFLSKRTYKTLGIRPKLLTVQAKIFSPL